ncbi:MAG: hypothetical protein MUC58_14075 [Rhizobiaceae bacterium]|jgi:hypothetical protein|nr:hypothetical protein [Rhizobiaceae bacterium]
MPSFRQRRLSRRKDGRSIEVVEWRDMESAQAAAAEIGSASGAKTFLSMIDMATIEMHHYEIVAAC